MDGQLLSKLFTKALANKQVNYFTAFPDVLLAGIPLEWKRYTEYQVQTYGYIPSPEQASLDLKTFLPVSSELPIERLFNDAKNYLESIYYQEELTKFMDKNIKAGKEALLGVREFTEMLKAKSHTISPQIVIYNDFSREQYVTNMRRSKFGIQILDDATSGILGGDYVLAVGGFKSGKTTTMNVFARLAFETMNENIIVCAMESSPLQMAANFDAMFGNMAAGTFRKGIDDEVKRKLGIVEKNMRGRENKLVIAPRISHPAEIIDIMESLPWETHKVFIDGINLLGNRTAVDTNQMYVGLTQASRILKEIALKKNVAIIGVTQANRQGAKNKDVPEATDVGGAIALVQDCDIALGTKFGVTDNGVRGVINKLILNRHGNTDNVGFLLNINYSNYETNVYPMVQDSYAGNLQDKLTGLEELRNTLERDGIDTSSPEALALMEHLA